MVKTIGALISSQRIKLGLTQKAVADYCGVSEGTVSRWESGDIDNMRRDRIASLAQILRISPLLLLGTDEGKVEISVSAEIKNGTPEYDLMQAYLRHPQRVREEIIRRANSIDTTFAQNVSRLLKASGDINGFMKETGLDFDAVGKFMQGEPVMTSPEEAERIADYFHADIVEMFFDEEVSSFEEPSKDIDEPGLSPEWESIEELLDDEIVLAKEGSLARASFIVLKKYLKNELTASYDTTMSTIKMIKGSNFERWWELTLAKIIAAQPHRFKIADILFFVVKQLYEDPDGFMINYFRSAHAVQNLIGALLAEQEKAAQKDDEA